MNSADSLDFEIHACQETQSWAPGSIRSRWVSELIELREALKEGILVEIKLAEQAAIIEGYRLAEDVARSLTDPRFVQERMEDYEVDLTNVDTSDNAAMVTAARSQRISFDNALNGNRDGYTVDHEVAVAYASCRSWDPEIQPSRWVEIDLLTNKPTWR